MTFKLPKNLHADLLAGCKFLLSFLKRNWSLEDYPVIVRKQRDSGQQPHKDGRLTLPSYYARIVNWTLAGTGDTATDALKDLSKTFNLAREHRASMPRPGAHVPLEFASQERIAAYSSLADEFLQSVFGVKGAWISDESSLWNFTSEDSLDRCHARIRSLYAVDVSDIQSGNLADIFERIAQSKMNQTDPL